MHKSFREACKRAGITYEVRMYDIRHRFASELFAKNVSRGCLAFDRPFENKYDN